MKTFLYFGLIVGLLACAPDQKTKTETASSTSVELTSPHQAPQAGSWFKVSQKNAPKARIADANIAVGPLVVIFGGRGLKDEPIADGAIYNTRTDSWEPIPAIPGTRESFSSTWADEKLFVWGGSDRSANYTKLDSGFLYDLRSKQWNLISPNHAPTARYLTKAHTFGKNVVIWGGHPGCDILDGAIFNTQDNSWRKMAPPPHSITAGCDNSVWNESQLFVWGNTPESKPDQFSGGAIYDLSLDQWTEIPTQAPGAPVPGKHSFLSVSPESKLVILGGTHHPSPQRIGGIYDPKKKTWIPIQGLSKGHFTGLSKSAYLDSSHLFIWGEAENNPDFFLKDKKPAAGILDLSSGQWKPVSVQNSPDFRFQTSVGRVGKNIVVFGCPEFLTECKNTDGIYNPELDNWEALPPFPGTPKRYSFNILTENYLFIWGGMDCKDDECLSNEGYILHF